MANDNLKLAVELAGAIIQANATIISGDEQLSSDLVQSNDVVLMVKKLKKI
ncbi:hypothetical protein [Latilactobacillus sakei]|uniref:hypothetical protein n=1 Tax=Latilactobacillus sakei TaxID=1599 RepID=UPI000A7BDE84